MTSTYVPVKGKEDLNALVQTLKADSAEAFNYSILKEVAEAMLMSVTVILPLISALSSVALLFTTQQQILGPDGDSLTYAKEKIEKELGCGQVDEQRQELLRKRSLVIDTLNMAAAKTGNKKPFISFVDTFDAYSISITQDIIIGDDMLRVLDDDEIRFVVCHEYGHVIQDDSAISLTYLAATSALEVLSFLFWLPGLLIVPAVAVPLEAQINQLVELRADRRAAEILETTQGGQKLFMRFMDWEQPIQDFYELGYDEQEAFALQIASQKPSLTHPNRYRRLLQMLEMAKELDIETIENEVVA